MLGGARIEPVSRHGIGSRAQLESIGRDDQVQVAGLAAAQLYRFGRERICDALEPGRASNVQLNSRADNALDVLKAQGATLVDVDDYDMEPINKHENVVLLTEMKADLNAYLARSPPAVKTRTLADLIAFDKAEPREMPWFGQELFERAEKAQGLDDPEYIEARDTNRRLAGPEGIDRLLREHDVVALISPSRSPASVIDLVNGGSGHGANSGLPAIAGYPYITVPMGEIHGLPVGISFIGPKWSEERLLSLAYAYEQATHARRAPTYAAGLPSE